MHHLWEKALDWAVFVSCAFSRELATLLGSHLGGGSATCSNPDSWSKIKSELNLQSGHVQSPLVGRVPMTRNVAVEAHQELATHRIKGYKV